MELVSDYMREDTMRHALNELTRKTFFFDFEDWVTGGYFEGDYIPYSFIVIFRDSFIPSNAIDETVFAHSFIANLPQIVNLVVID